MPKELPITDVNYDDIFIAVDRRDEDEPFEQRNEQLLVQVGNTVYLYLDGELAVNSLAEACFGGPVCEVVVGLSVNTASLSESEARNIIKTLGDISSDKVAVA